MANLEQKYAENIKKEYEDKSETMTKIDEIRMLDKKVKTPALAFALVFGIIGSLILGIGMCLAMKIIGDTTVTMVFGIIIGLIGIAIVAINYPLYQKILASRKAKYKDAILAKTNEVLNNK